MLLPARRAGRPNRPIFAANPRIRTDLPRRIVHNAEPLEHARTVVTHSPDPATRHVSPPADAGVGSVWLGPTTGKPTLCRLDVPRRFNPDDIGTAGLARGWHGPTATGLRNADAEAVLDLLLQHPPTACRLKVSGQSIGQPGSKVAIACFANNRWIGYWRTQAGDTATLVAEIEPEVFRPAPSASALRLAWHFSSWQEPGRTLDDGGFEFASIVLKNNQIATLATAAATSAAATDLASAPAGGEDFTTDPGICLLCADRVVRPDISGDWYEFRLPPALGDLFICSNASIPARIDAGQDERLLGIAIAEIAIGARRVPLGHWSLRDGWHAPEETCRWTNGAAHLLLPARSTLLRIRVVGRLEQYRI
jgi:hypothetical protein